MIPTKQEMEKVLVARHGVERFRAFSSAVVAVCGLGGLGSNISIALARAGIGKLVLIDFDRVDVSNLHRQQYKATQVGMLKTEALYENLSEIAPYAEIEIHSVKMNVENMADLIKDCSVVCEAFDNAEAKAAIADVVTERFPEKYLVSASGMAGFGPSNAIKTRKITDKFYLCGDGVSDVNDGIGLVSSRVMLCAAHQAHTVLRILSREFEV